MISTTKIKEIIEKKDEGSTLDYKQNLKLETEGDKAQFIKDVLSLANSGQIAHIIIGVEDGTRKPIGFNNSHTQEQINQILQDKCDPPISTEYAEINIFGYVIGIIEINGNNPPYIVAVPDKYGGKLSSGTQKQFHIERGTVFIRNYNMNAGALRADLDTIYEKKQYVALQANVQLTNEVTVKPTESSNIVDINFFLENIGEVIAANTLAWLQFKNVKRIIKCSDLCQDISSVNDKIPTIGINPSSPIVRPIRTHCGSVTVEVGQDIRQIDAEVIIGALNMRTKEGSYTISLKKKEQI